MGQVTCILLDEMKQVGETEQTHPALDYGIIESSLESRQIGERSMDENTTGKA